jgi:hypothetical protein
VTPCIICSSSLSGWSLGSQSTTSAGTRELWQALRPYATGGVYVNDISREADEGADQIRGVYRANYQRLAELKQKYDSRNLFGHNQNIKPVV